MLHGTTVNTTSQTSNPLKMVTSCLIFSTKLRLKGYEPVQLFHKSLSCHSDGVELVAGTVNITLLE